MDKKHCEVFDSALYGVSERLARVLFFLNDETKSKVQEIRLRSGKAVALTVLGKTLFIKEDSSVSELPAGCVTADKKDLEESYRRLCQSSVFSRMDEIKNGFVIMKGGHRAGVCGTFGNGGIGFVSSVNIRIARQVTGAADFLKNHHNGGVLIAGPPGCGKTTVLRDFLRYLSGGESGEYFRVAVVDVRGEIAASFEGVAYNDLGVTADVLMGVEKAQGAEIAIRTLYPHYVAFDEIGSTAELKAVFECLYSGVRLITTAHAGSREELMKRQVTKELLLSGAIETVAFLKAPAGSGAELFSAEEVIKNCG